MKVVNKTRLNQPINNKDDNNNSIPSSKGNLLFTGGITNFWLMMIGVEIFILAIVLSIRTRKHQK